MLRMKERREKRIEKKMDGEESRMGEKRRPGEVRRRGETRGGKGGKETEGRRLKEKMR